jgi:hypothetical protein
VWDDAAAKALFKYDVEYPQDAAAGYVLTLPLA